MDCRNSLNLLEAYLDKELDRADARELEAHLDSCADCRTALTRLDELRLALRDRGLRYAAPDALRARISAAVRDPSSTLAPRDSVVMPRFARRRAGGWLRIAAACVLAFGAGATTVHWWNSARDDDNRIVAHDLFASHWRALAAASPVDVVSTDRHTVKPWFAGKVAQAPRVDDFAEQGFALVGGRIDYAGSSRVPVLVYRHGQHLIDVFVLPGAAEAPAQTSQLGYALDPVRLGSQAAVIVSDLDAQELHRFENLIAARNETP
jgi:mycothiol system anti-sigma-R factor